MTKKKELKDKKIPVYFTVNKEIHDYLENEVLKSGLSLSAVVTIAIQREREQKTALDTLAGVMVKMNEDDNKKK
jgi:hypothetical protein